MIIVGLTGGIASGKSTVSSFLKKKKFPVHDSDLVVKKIYLNLVLTEIKIVLTLSLWKKYY